MTDITFRPYSNADCQACTDIFDANCPESFAPNERQDYERFLEDVPEGYEVCEVDGCVLGAFGLVGDGNDAMILNWILLDPTSRLCQLRCNRSSSDTSFSTSSSL
jgi:hypothetical protein